MGADRDPLDAVVTVLALPFRIAGRGVGYLAAVGLLLLVPVVLVTAFTLAWFVPLFAVELSVGLPFDATVGLMAAVGVPARAVGVPTPSPFVMGVLTALVLGLPNPDHEGEFDPSRMIKP